MPNVTKLYLLDVPLEADYKHTFYFGTPLLQKNYFYSKTKEENRWEDFSYQMKDNKVRVPKQFDEISGKVNYVMYQNSAYSDKWFYAFILDMKFISDGVTEIYIMTDVIQTWLFDYKIKSCFVEREHVKDDTIGKNTLPEGLETGEYICNKTIHDRTMETTDFILASTVDLETGADSGLMLYDGVVNGWYYYHFSSIDEIEDKLTDLETLRTNDAIVSIFVMPRQYLKTDNNGILMQNHVPIYKYWNDFRNGDRQEDEIINKPTDINGYVPKNKKLFTYPYTYLLMDNNSGASAVYHYELFKNGDPLTPNVCDFIIYSAITPGGSFRLLPLGYAGVEGENNNYGLPGGKFPICGWQSDYYTNWLTQNALNIEVQTESIHLAYQQNMKNSIISAAGSGADFLMGASGGGLANTLNSFTDTYFHTENANNQIKGITAQKQMHAFQSPTTAGNINCGDVNFVRGAIHFTAYQMSIKEEYARIIDNYFSLYGYQINRVKVPFEDHRQRYWYTKTVGCEIDGAIPNADMQIIKGCYDKGITFWRSNYEIGVYTDENDNLFANSIIED